MEAELPIRIPLDLVESSAILAIGHDAPRLILAVQFKSGAIWHYAGVEPFVYREFVDAFSIGQYFARNIKGRYAAQKMTGTCSACGAQHGWIGDPCTACGCDDYQPEPRPNRSPAPNSPETPNASRSSD